MASNRHTDEVFTQKRKPKNPIKFKLTLNEEQKLAKSIILESPIIVLKGNAGSGKTFLAVQTALDLLFSGDIEQVVITRPTVSKEEIGFLPGDIKEKMDPWLAPIYQNMYALYDKIKIEKCIAEEKIKIVPFAFIRGITFCNSFVIVDEAQNVTHDQMQAVIGRLGKGSKMVICGDLSQNDLKVKKDSGFSFLNRIEENVPGFKIVKLLQNHRHEIVSPILQVYQDFRD
jgi:phosphate starvation-inducible protein PhoH and related proteins